MNKDVTIYYDESLVAGIKHSTMSNPTWVVVANPTSPFILPTTSDERYSVQFDFVTGVTVDQLSSVWKHGTSTVPWADSTLGRSVVTNSYVKPSTGSTDEISFMLMSFEKASFLSNPLTPPPPLVNGSFVWAWKNTKPVTMYVPWDYEPSVNPTPEPEPEPTQTLICNVNMNHVATMSWRGQSAVGGVPLNFEWNGSSATLEIVFSEGVEIQSVPTVQYYNRGTGKFDVVSSLVERTYTVIWNKEAYFNQNQVLDFETYIELSEISTPFNKSFLMGREAMAELTHVMQAWNSSSWDGGSDYANDSDAEFILNLLLLPFKLSEEVIGEDLPIIVGATNTGIVSPLIVEDQVVVDLGNIEVPAIGSVLDYQGVEFELHLPFIADIISVEPVEVVGKVLNIRYLLDIYTGAVSVNLYNGLDYPFFSMSTKLGRAIPFKFFESVSGSMENIYPVDNRLFSAYLRESRAEVVEGQFNNLITQTGTLNGVGGYVEVEHCELVDVAESSTVVDILKGGVIIK